MSPVSRGRKGKKNQKRTSKRAMPAMPKTPEECDCPVCTGESFDPQQLIDELTSDSADLIAAKDPLEAEMAGAAFVSIGDLAGEGFDDVLVRGLIPEFEKQNSSEALALLLAFGAVTDGLVSKTASAAANRLIEAGVRRPSWAAELSEPVRVDDCRHVRDAQGVASMLTCSFHRGGRSHAVVISVNQLDCGAASEIVLLEVNELPQALAVMRSIGHDNDVKIIEDSLDPAEFRWQVEKALDARAVHDSSDLELGRTDESSDASSEYRVLAKLLRARMRALPAPSKPPATHGNEDSRLSALNLLSEIAGKNPSGRGEISLPAKRKKSDGPAPTYQIKVGLRGAKPPIWRRLEVPADISLDRLHAVIQVAFGWYDSHMHVFETPYGDFGVDDAELGFRSEIPVTLEQIAPEPKSKTRYTYDFGDNWEHDILLEKVLEAGEAARNPRCTGGRRAAPPEDCGGIWGYSDLTQILADPAHPEHEDMVDWVGLDSATEFDPAHFDAGEVTQALSRLR
jgi:hypothetical protein